MYCLKLAAEEASTALLILLTPVDVCFFVFVFFTDAFVLKDQYDLPHECQE